MAASLLSVSTPAAGPGDDSVTLNYPGMQFNQVLVAIVMVDAGVGNTVDFYNPTSVDGWQTIANTATGVRRGVMALWRAVTGTEGSTTTVYATTSGFAGNVGGCIAVFSGAHPVAGVYAAGTAGITNGTAASPADVTTTTNDELAVAAFAYANLGTISAISANSWVEANAEVNDGTWSYDWQTLVVPTATTITGGSATLGTSGNHGIVTFALKSFIPLAQWGRGLS